MIKFTDSKADIIPLWKEAFGDSKEDIVFFLKNCKNKRCLAYFESGKCVSLMFLVDACLNGEKARYIYAACTEKNSRGRGYMSALLDFANEKYGRLCLIPADEGLIKYYQKRGFAKSSDISGISFDETEEIKEYLFEGCFLSKPLILIRG